MKKVGNRTTSGVCIAWFKKTFSEKEAPQSRSDNFKNSDTKEHILHNEFQYTITREIVFEIRAGWEKSS